PNAYSSAHAAGLWQFIKETGQRYGLEVSEYVDERRDPVKATGAALTYLQDMHERFDSWFLAAAGYNTGENRVGRLMREVTGSERGTEEDYWKIWPRLPRETRDYVPLMLARSEEHTSELQSRENLVCRLLLEKKKQRTRIRR